MTVQKYVSVPTIVEAWRLVPDELDDIAKWCKGKRKGLSITFPKIRDRTKNFDSSDHNSYAVCGDVIIRVAKGFVLMKGEDFDRRFKPAGERVSV